MGLFNFSKKEKTIKRDDRGEITGTVSLEQEIVNPLVVSSNFITLFYSIPEVFFPIDFIASRVAGGNFQLKRSKDDSVVFENEEINKFFNKPNPITSFYEFIYSHIAYYLTTGNSYIKAALPSLFNGTNELWRKCDNYWVLPPENVDIATDQLIPLFGVAEKSDIIKTYTLKTGYHQIEIPSNLILHVKNPNLKYDSDYLKGRSKLESQIRPISNLIAVYEARNVIYIKRGGLGFLVSLKKDETGSVALTPSEKKAVRDEFYNLYGLSRDKSPVGLSDVNLGFVRTNMSITDLQPFDETLLDAVSIAGAFGIPGGLVPRKDHSTFSNRSVDEKGVYSSVVIPEANKLARGLTDFLGLENSGLYIDVDFSHIDVLQEGLKEKHEIKKTISERCRLDFLSGIITLNDWRAQIGESMVGDSIYNKLILMMSDSELKRISIIINGVRDGNIETTNV